MSTTNGAGGDAEGADGDGAPGPGRPGAPTPLVLSIAFGALGFLLLVAGLVAGSTGLAVAGFVAGSLSLGAALYWRSLLISAWGAQKKAREQD